MSSSAEARVRSLPVAGENRGKWDRNRTCNLRFWSLLPYVQQRSGTYTSPLEIGLLDGPTCLDVPQRSPALGSNVSYKVFPIRLER